MSLIAALVGLPIPIESDAEWKLAGELTEHTFFCDDFHLDNLRLLFGTASVHMPECWTAALIKFSEPKEVWVSVDSHPYRNEALFQLVYRRPPTPVPAQEATAE